MSKQVCKLKAVPVNKTVVFYSPVEGDDVLVRTGTVENSSFFHALLHGYSKDYAIMKKEDRDKYVKKLRSTMVGKIDKNSWKNIDLATPPFQEEVQFLLKNTYTFLNSSEEKSGEKRVRKVIKKLIKDEITASRPKTTQPWSSTCRADS